jgi:hypothetical protein
LNGALLVDQAICEAEDDYIISCAFYEGESNEWLERELLFTGHKRGVVNVRLMCYRYDLMIPLLILEYRCGTK